MKSYEIALLIVTATICVTTFMLLTAANPSADDFWRGVGSMGAGVAAGYMARR